jgi:hypothetical protein
MKPYTTYTRLFCVAALTGVVALFFFADSAWAPAECGDGNLALWAGEECEVGIPCADPADICDESTCLCSSVPDECGDGILNQSWEECEVGVPCADPGDTCDEAACLCSPPSGGEGCTPGYWRQPHHLDSWEPTNYGPGASVAGTFGSVDPTVDDLTLLEAVQLKGGKLNALMRHAVAALLNAAHPDVSYAMSSADVIAAVQDAVSSGEIEAAKDDLEAENEEGCPLN